MANLDLVKIKNIIDTYDVSSISFLISEDDIDLMLEFLNKTYSNNGYKFWTKTCDNQTFIVVEKEAENTDDAIVFSENFHKTTNDFETLVLDLDELKFLKKILQNPRIRSEMRRKCYTEELNNGMYKIKKIDVYERICNILSAHSSDK